MSKFAIVVVAGLNGAALFLLLNKVNTAQQGYLFGVGEVHPAVVELLYAFLQMAFTAICLQYPKISEYISNFLKQRPIQIYNPEWMEQQRKTNELLQQLLEQLNEAKRTDTKKEGVVL